MKYIPQYNRQTEIVASSEVETHLPEDRCVANQAHYLQCEIDRLIEMSDVVRSSGSVAPPKCWVTVVEMRSKRGRIYRYARLVSESSDRVTTRLLGRPGSDDAIDWQWRCRRRDAIAEIEQQMRMVSALVDRQRSHKIRFQPGHVPRSKETGLG
jgi:hypothetical protein